MRQHAEPQGSETRPDKLGDVVRQLKEEQERLAAQEAGLLADQRKTREELEHVAAALAALQPRAGARRARGLPSHLQSGGIKLAEAIPIVTGILASEGPLAEKDVVQRLGAHVKEQRRPVSGLHLLVRRILARPQFHASAGRWHVVTDKGSPSPNEGTE